ncbi:hypothetical protein J7E83_09390 [Arthrobacter sp. ISL-48]|uniref:type II secretion system F family protein n=1 Tax=Arthrobacter sp. ISL-48 TaxID=2819110 RepID=UPI001BE9ED18|nr:hypothetical protein [Arthrobacter sp. ISL-48]MBT2532335.1 hypothetical protein [Arthrobacter sp. ISL-48]
MIVLLVAALTLAVFLVLRPPGGTARRFRRATGGRGAGGLGSNRRAGGRGRPAARGAFRPEAGPVPAGKGAASISMTLVVQQLAALLKGGRTQARLWEELWLVYASGLETASNRPATIPAGTSGTSPSSPGRPRPGLSAGSVAMLGAAQSAAFRGSPVSDSIRISAPAAFPRLNTTEPRIWFELAACFDIAEASGCPLADVLTRFAAQLEVEDDAEAARQTALAGPKATVSLLTWLPLMGLGLGIALGADPLAVLLGTPLGLAALAAGASLTVAGRVWSARLVSAAAGAGVP